MNHDAFAARIAALRACLGNMGRVGRNPVDAFLVVCQDGLGWEDVYYLTGFVGSASALLVTSDSAELFLDARYPETAEAGLGGIVSCVATGRRSPLQAAIDALAEVHPTRLAYGGRRMGYGAYRHLERAIGSAVGLVDMSNLLSNLRRRKSREETDCIREAVRIASAAFRQTLPLIHAGMSERDLACELAYRLQRLGSDFVDPVPVMVSCGKRTALPHAVPGNERLAVGDLVMIDFGARAAGYVCDITRMLSVGEPSQEVRTLHGLLLWAQAEAASLLAPGRAVQEVDAAARGVLESAHLGGWMIHALGHGIGLNIHETPSISAAPGCPLAAGDVVTLEPGIYRNGWGGLRIEDDYLVTANGACCLSSDLSRELCVV